MCIYIIFFSRTLMNNIKAPGDLVTERVCVGEAETRDPPLFSCPLMSTTG